MHEAKICLGLLALADEALGSAGGERIVALRVAIGDWSGLVPEALEAVFPICAAGTRAEGARLRIERTAGRELVLRDLEVS